MRFASPAFSAARMEAVDALAAPRPTSPALGVVPSGATVLGAAALSDATLIRDEVSTPVKQSADTASAVQDGESTTSSARVGGSALPASPPPPTSVGAAPSSVGAAPSSAALGVEQSVPADTASVVLDSESVPAALNDVEPVDDTTSTTPVPPPSPVSAVPSSDPSSSPADAVKLSGAGVRGRFVPVPAALPSSASSQSQAVDPFSVPADGGGVKSTANTAGKTINPTSASLPPVGRSNLAVPLPPTSPVSLDAVPSSDPSSSPAVKPSASAAELNTGAGVINPSSASLPRVGGRALPFDWPAGALRVVGRGHGRQLDLSIGRSDRLPIGAPVDRSDRRQIGTPVHLVVPSSVDAFTAPADGGMSNTAAPDDDVVVPSAAAPNNGGMSSTAAPVMPSAAAPNIGGTSSTAAPVMPTAAAPNIGGTSSTAAPVLPSAAAPNIGGMSSTAAPDDDGNTIRFGEQTVHLDPAAVWSSSGLSIQGMRFGRSVRSGVASALLPGQRGHLLPLSRLDHHNEDAPLLRSALRIRRAPVDIERDIERADDGERARVRQMRRRRLRSLAMILFVCHGMLMGAVPILERLIQDNEVALEWAKMLVWIVVMVIYGLSREYLDRRYPVTFNTFLFIVVHAIGLALFTGLSYTPIGTHGHLISLLVAHLASYSFELFCALIAHLCFDTPGDMGEAAI